MTDTANLSLPKIAAAQAQKHVTHNEALERLDALVQLAVLGAAATPAASPTEGDRYICASGATGDWAGHDAEIAAWQAGAWVFYPPQEGWRAWVSDISQLNVFDGTNWVAASSGSGGGGSLQNVPLVGVNASADASNRLSVSAPNSLFNHEGSDHRLKINRASASDTASVLFQTGFSGSAEFGVMGDDRFRLKVSPDGSQWHDALSIDGNTGRVSLELEDHNKVYGGPVIDPGNASQPMIFPYGFSGYSNTTLTTYSVGRRYKVPVFVPSNFTCSQVSFIVKTPGAAGARLRIGLRRWDRSNGWSMRELLFETGEIAADVAGRMDVSVGPQAVPAGWYVLDVVSNDASIGLLGQIWQYISHPAFGCRFQSGTLRPIITVYQDAGYSALPADDVSAIYTPSYEGRGNFCIGLS